MKKIKILVASILFGSFTYGQGPIGNPPSPGTVPVNANSAWYRGGNFNIGVAGNNNIFGAMWNSPIHIFTDSRNIAQFTQGNSLSSLTGNSGDGLRIVKPVGSGVLGI